MCGRCRCTLRADDVHTACYRDGPPVGNFHMDRYHPSYNVSPGSSVPVLRRASEADGKGVAVHCMKWGLIPSFTKKTEKPDFYKMFNARAESASEKASFRRLLPKNRCLVAVEGFYEWKKDGSKKQPYYIHFKDGRPLVFAALYDSWQSSEGETLYTFTILTTSSSSALQWLHDRMPVILGDKGSTDTWLVDSSASKFNTVLKPYENTDLVWYPVTPAMGKTSFDGPECIKEIPLKVPEKNLISKFFTAKEPKKEEMKRNNEIGGDSPIHLNQEQTTENRKQALISGRTMKKEESSEENKTIPDESVKTGLPKILKVETPTDSSMGISSSIRSRKEEPAKGKTSIPDESIDAGVPKILKVCYKTECRIDAENEESNQKSCFLKMLEKEAKAEDLKGAASLSEMENSSSKHSARNPTKRDYEVFSAGKKPAKQVEKVKKQRDLKSSSDKQSTLLAYFGKN